MAPNHAKLAKACKAMEPYGIPEEKVKAELKHLLNLYNNQWDLIEEDNFRVLLEYFFEGTGEENKSEAALETKEQAQPSRNKRARTSYSGSPQQEGKEEIFSETDSIGKGSDIEKESGIVNQDNMLELYEDEYCVALPGPLHEDGFSNGKCSNNTKADDSKFLESNKPLDVEDNVAGVSNSSRLDIGSPLKKSDAKDVVGGNDNNQGKLDTQPGLSNGLVHFQNNAEAVPQVPKHVHLEGSGNSDQVNGFNALKDHSSNMEGVQKNDNIVEDISGGEESVLISLVNDNGAMELPKFHYISKNMVYKKAYVNFSLARISDDNCCPHCYGDCLLSIIQCACAGETCGEFAYTPDGLVKERFLDECIAMNQRPSKHHYYYCKTCPLEKKKKGRNRCKGHLMRKFIKECWSKCGCNRKCGNRVVQRGIQQILQVFTTSEGKGWGLRSVHRLKKGTFVCEYVGEIVTNQELHERNEERTGNEKHTYPVMLDCDWGSERILEDEEALCLDATEFGNAARFINHRCYDANMVEIPVEVETPDHHYYHLAFFTTREIKEMEELTWDYGIEFDDENHPVKAFRCKCGSLLCRDKNRKSRGINRTNQ